MSEYIITHPFQQIEIPHFNLVTGWNEVEIRESGEPLVLLNDLDPRIACSPQYYLQDIPHASERMYARQGVAESLVKAADLLPNGHTLVLWDTWRPLEVQQALFDDYHRRLKAQNPSLPDKQLIELTQTYVSLPSSDPTRPSPHFTGAAVDLTLADPNGNLLDMGTEFDHFGPEAATRYLEELEQPSPQQIIQRKNRRTFTHAMIEAGFSPYEAEWWHFDKDNQFDVIRTGKPFAIYGIPNTKGIN